MKKLAQISLLLIVLILTSCDDKKVVETNSIKGTWRCEDYSTLTGRRVYMVDIERSNNDTTKYILSNFNNEGVDNEGTYRFVTSHLNKFTLTIDPSQQIFGTQTLIKSGTGVVSANFARIELSYKILVGKSDYEIQAVYTRP